MASTSALHERGREVAALSMSGRHGSATRSLERALLLASLPGQSSFNRTNAIAPVGLLPP